MGLTRVVNPAARHFLEARGGTVLSGRGVAAVGERHVELRGGERLEADGIVLAIPPRMAHEVAPDALPDEPGLNASPIVNVHLWYDRPVMDEPFEAVIDSPAQWVFNRSAMDHGGAGRDGEHHLAVSISGARGEVEVPRDELAAAIRAEVEALYPRARDAGLVASAVVKEPRATFAAAPGQASRRPGTATAGPGGRAGRRVDRHGVAGDDGGRRPQRHPRRPARTREPLSDTPQGHYGSVPAVAAGGGRRVAPMPSAASSVALVALLSLGRARPGRPDPAAGRPVRRARGGPEHQRPCRRGVRAQPARAPT